MAWVDGDGTPIDWVVPTGATARGFFRVGVIPSPLPPDGFVLIPAGSFEMGDTFGEGIDEEFPVHPVYVSAFFLAETETTYARWLEVYNWALANGYHFDHPGEGKADNHPVHSVSWYDVVKWCNAASEREEKAPVYRLPGGDIFRTGQETPMIDYGAGGYRLPTEAEWEKASRGGLSGMRFPWGNTISHAIANYSAHPLGYDYDVSPTISYHPDHNDGDWPFTSPVGRFAPNGYGLFDMAGNVSELCNDQYSRVYYNESPGIDPRGPETFPASHIERGGSYLSEAWGCRSASRRSDLRLFDAAFRGFRLALGRVP